MGYVFSCEGALWTSNKCASKLGTGRSICFPAKRTDFPPKVFEATWFSTLLLRFQKPSWYRTCTFLFVDFYLLSWHTPGKQKNMYRSQCRENLICINLKGHERTESSHAPPGLHRRHISASPGCRSGRDDETRNRRNPRPVRVFDLLASPVRPRLLFNALQFPQFLQKSKIFWKIAPLDENKLMHTEIWLLEIMNIL